MILNNYEGYIEKEFKVVLDLALSGISSYKLYKQIYI